MTNKEIEQFKRRILLALGYRWDRSVERDGVEALDALCEAVSEFLEALDRLEAK